MLCHGQASLPENQASARPQGRDLWPQPPPLQTQYEIYRCSQVFTLSRIHALGHAIVQFLSLEVEYTSCTTGLGLGHVTDSGHQDCSMCHEQRLKIRLHSLG